MSALSYVRTPSDDNCSICRSPLNELDDEGKTQQVVGHLNDGELVHHAHKICLLSWLVINPICPTCRDPLDARSLLTRVDILTEKFGSLLQNLKEARDRIAADEETAKGLAGIATITLMLGAMTAILVLMKRPPLPFPCEFEWEVPFLLKLRAIMGPHCDTAFEIRQLTHFRKLAHRTSEARLAYAPFLLTFGKGIIPWRLCKELLSLPRADGA